MVSSFMPMVVRQEPGALQAPKLRLLERTGGAADVPVAAAPSLRPMHCARPERTMTFVIVRLRYNRIPKDRSRRSRMAVRHAGAARNISLWPEHRGTWLRFVRERVLEANRATVLRGLEDRLISRTYPVLKVFALDDHSLDPDFPFFDRFREWPLDELPHLHEIEVSVTLS